MSTIYIENAAIHFQSRCGKSLLFLFLRCLAVTFCTAIPPTVLNTRQRIVGETAVQNITARL